jgi:hypothetical protein
LRVEETHHASQNQVGNEGSAPGTTGMSASNQKGARVVIGIAAIAGAATLLYFSLSPAITCTRADARVDCEVTAKMLNVFAVDSARVSGVREVLMIESATGRSRTPPHLNFRTAAGDVDLGYFSQRFAGDWTRLDSFARESADPELTIDTGVTFRNVAAYGAALFLLLAGLAAMASSGGRHAGRSVYDHPS